MASFVCVQACESADSVLVVDTSFAYTVSQPITSSPDGPADVIGQQITERLSKEYGKEVTYAQMIFDWLKSTGVVAVTCVHS